MSDAGAAYRPMCDRHPGYTVEDCQFRGPCGDEAFLAPVVKALRSDEAMTPDEFDALMDGKRADALEASAHPSGCVCSLCEEDDHGPA